MSRLLARIRSDLDALAALIGDLEPQAPERAAPAAWITNMLAAKKRRDEIFPGEGFGDPGWDLLLELYAVELAKGKIATSELGTSASVAPSTALRWLWQLEESGLIERTRDTQDKRRLFVKLTPKGLAAMRRYFGQRQRP